METFTDNNNYIMEVLREQTRAYEFQLEQFKDLERQYCELETEKDKEIEILKKEIAELKLKMKTESE